jgi:hypothetical protein
MSQFPNTLWGSFSFERPSQLLLWIISIQR